MATNETVNQEVEQATEQAEKTFTQSELDQIIGERLKREREKYPDYDALKEKGYNPINQLVGYLISGDPSYITSYNGARALLRKLERDEILEEVIKSYLDIK